MIASYSDPRFIDRVKSGEKIHTIRADRARRWREGLKVQHWTGSPRNPKSNPKQFQEDVCTGTQRVFIHGDFGPSGGVYSFVNVDGRQLSSDEIDQLAKNDGFDNTREFYKWFGAEFSGIIVHWTDKRY